jgi:hypothetical protein
MSMKGASPFEKRPDVKLRWLRKLDRVAPWHTADDRRLCTRCERMFSGREARIAGGTRSTGPLRVECPTRGCNSTPAQWIARPPAVATAGVQRRNRHHRADAVPLGARPALFGMIF